MILLDSLLLALLSVVCVVEISIFSHRFRTVLTTLGAINQVGVCICRCESTGSAPPSCLPSPNHSPTHKPTPPTTQVPTDSQVRTIVWITVFGNAFFVTRAAMELFLAATFIALWKGACVGAGVGAENDGLMDGWTDGWMDGYM